MKDEEKEQKRRKMIEMVYNHQTQGEVYIQTKGRVWKTLVLNHFNRVQKGELSVMELVQLLETKYAVKYLQKYSLIRYPIEDCLYFIAKIANKPLELKE